MLAVKRFLNLRRGRINVRKEVNKQLRIQKRLQNDIFKKLQTLYRTQIKKASNQYKTTQDFEPVFFVRETTALTETVMRQHYKKVFSVVYNDNEETYDRGRKQEEVFVFGRSVEFEGLIDDYFRTRTPYFSNVPNQVAISIQNQIQEGRSNNLTLDQISRNITATNKIGRSRSALIARTETHNAASFANHQYHKTASKDYGIEMVKRWAATGDLRTRSAHSAANGQTVPMDDKFLVGGAEMEYAGDPAGGAKNVINCRCVIIYVEKEEVENVIDQIEKPTVNDKPATTVDRPTRLLDQDIDISPESQQRWLGRFAPFGTKPDKLREMIREAIEAQTVNIDAIYGSTIPAELSWHRSTKHWLGETNIINSLKKVAPLAEIINKGQGAKFALGKTTAAAGWQYKPTINMGRYRSSKSKVGAITFRHEYGHHIDHDNNLLTKYAAAKKDKFNRQGKDTYQVAFSREAADEFVEDGASLAKLKKEAEERYINTFSKDLNPFEQGTGYQFYDEVGMQLGSVNYGDFVYSDSFLKKIGLSVTRKEFRDDIQGTRTRRKRVGLAEKLQRDVDFDTFEKSIVNLIDNSPHARFKYNDLKMMLGDDFLLQIDKTGDYYNLVNIVAKLQSGYDSDFFTMISSLSRKFDKQGLLLGKEALYFDDFLGSITKGQYTSGHGVTYYVDELTSGFRKIDNTIPINKNKLTKSALEYLENNLKTVNKNMTTEAFANYISLLGGENAKFWRRLMNLYAPNTTRKFDEIIDFINGVDD